MSNLKPDLPQSLQDQLNDLLARSGKADREGNGPLSMQLVEEAWSLLPEPKTEWNFYPQTIARSTVETIPEIGQCDHLDVWLDRIYVTHFDPGRQSEYTNLIAGHSLFQCGRKAEATTLFKHVLINHGPKWFSGEHHPYLELAEQP